MGGGERSGRTERERACGAESLARPSRALTALTTSALAVPGLALPARADTPVEQASSSYAFSYYLEDDLESDRLAPGGGSRERYEVLTHQLDFKLPVAKRVDVGIGFLYEEMSGASPWFVQPDTTGDKRLQVMSGATIEDERYDLSADLSYYMDESKDTFSTGFSKERDYLSVHGGLGTERSFADKNTTFSTSGSFSYDWIEPTDADLFAERPSAGERWSVDLFAGLSQILSRASAVQGTINYKHSDGYLSDPYKAIRGFTAGDPIVSDRRPDQKDQVSLLLRYRHHFERVAGSLHADYRLYVDTWAVTSHTVELAWHQNLFGFLTIVPGVRYYSQSKADFYETLLLAGTVESTPGDRSSDYRLSPYGAVSGKIKAEVALEDVLDYQAGGKLEGIGFTGGLDLFAAFSYERYFSDGNFGLVSVGDEDEAPGLVNFQVFAVTLTGRF